MLRYNITVYTNFFLFFFPFRWGNGIAPLDSFHIKTWVTYIIFYRMWKKYFIPRCVIYILLCYWFVFGNRSHLPIQFIFILFYNSQFLYRFFIWCIYIRFVRTFVVYAHHTRVIQLNNVKFNRLVHNFYSEFSLNLRVSLFRFFKYF